MATSDVGRQFEEDLMTCLEIAQSFEEVADSDAKRVVAQYLVSLQKFLQEKQNDAEKHTRKEIQLEQDEIAELTDRIARLSTDNDAKGDVGPESIFQIWAELKENEWTDVWNCLINDKWTNPREILDTLIHILNLSYQSVKKHAKENLEDIMFQVKYPGQDKGNKDLQLTSADGKDLKDVCTTCQIMSTPFCLPSIQKVIQDEVNTDKTTIFMLSKTIDRTKTFVNNYILKCIEFSWSAVFKEPVIRLVTDPITNAEDRHMKEKFVRWKEVADKRMYVEWPALVQGSIIKVHWELYNPKQTLLSRPTKQISPVNDPRTVDTGERMTAIDDIQIDPSVKDEHNAGSAYVNTTGKLSRPTRQSTASVNAADNAKSEEDVGEIKFPEKDGHKFPEKDRCNQKGDNSQGGVYSKSYNQQTRDQIKNKALQIQGSQNDVQIKKGHPNIEDW